MPYLYGSLVVCMFVNMTRGGGIVQKRVTLATIPCEYAERETVFRKFVDDNGKLLKAHCHAEFVMRETVDLI